MVRGSTPNAPLDVGSGSVWFLSVVEGIDAGLVHIAVNAEPIGVVDSSRVRATIPVGKRGNHLDPAVLFSGDQADWSHSRKM